MKIAALQMQPKEMRTDYIRITQTKLGQSSTSVSLGHPVAQEPKLRKGVVASAECELHSIAGSVILQRSRTLLNLSAISKFHFAATMLLGLRRVNCIRDAEGKFFFAAALQLDLTRRSTRGCCVTATE